MTIRLVIDCDEPWFSLIKNGKKPVEGRKGKKKYRELKPGDKVCFRSTGSEDAFIAEVERVDVLSSIIDYLHSVTIEKALPGIESLEDGLTIYSQWNTREDIEQFGFVGIWIKPRCELCI